MAGSHPTQNGRILILVHETDAFEKMSYYMHLLSQVWREKGWHVAVQRGLGPPLEADLLILHVDLTVVPKEYVEYARQYPVVLNGGAVDISKRAISERLVARGDTHQGPVIVKTNLNFKGLRKPPWRERRRCFPALFIGCVWPCPPGGGLPQLSTRSIPPARKYPPPSGRIRT